MNHERLTVAHRAEAFLNQQRQHVAHDLWCRPVFEPKRLTDGVGHERFSIGPHSDRASFCDFVPDDPDGVGSDLHRRVPERANQSGCKRTGVVESDASDGSAEWHMAPWNADSKQSTGNERSGAASRRHRQDRFFCDGGRMPGSTSDCQNREMEASAISDPDMKAQIEAESKNFEFTTKTLGSTAELVQDFQELYKSLAGFVLIPDGGAATEAAKVAMISLHLLMKARGNAPSRKACRPLPQMSGSSGRRTRMGGGEEHQQLERPKFSVFLTGVKREVRCGETVSRWAVGLA